MTTTTRVYFRTVDGENQNFANLRASTLEELRNTIAAKLVDISKLVSQENREYWTKHYANLRIAKVTEIIEVLE